MLDAAIFSAFLSLDINQLIFMLMLCTKIKDPTIIEIEEKM